MPTLEGFNDDDLHANIPEALKVLAKAKEAYDHALRAIEGQYLRSIDAAYADQVDAVRNLYGQVPDVTVPTASVPSRFS